MVCNEGVEEEEKNNKETNPNQHFSIKARKKNTGECLSASPKASLRSVGCKSMLWMGEGLEDVGTNDGVGEGHPLRLKKETRDGPISPVSTNSA